MLLIIIVVYMWFCGLNTFWLLVRDVNWNGRCERWRFQFLVFLHFQHLQWKNKVIKLWELSSKQILLLLIKLETNVLELRLITIAVTMSHTRFLNNIVIWLHELSLKAKQYRINSRINPKPSQMRISWRLFFSSLLIIWDWSGGPSP